MNNLEANIQTEGGWSACLSVDDLIDYAFEPSEGFKSHIQKCSTCKIILEGIQHEIDSKRNDGELVSSDILKIQEQLKEDQLVDLINNEDYYTNLSENAGLSITTENMIRNDIELGDLRGLSGLDNNNEFRLFSLKTLGGRIAAGVSLVLVSLVVLLVFINEKNDLLSSNEGNLSEDGVELYELKTPVNIENLELGKKGTKIQIESRGDINSTKPLKSILNEKARKERIKSTQMNPFLLRITDKKSNSVLFQKAVSHPPKELYSTELKNEWSDTVLYKIDYYLIRNMELIDSLKKED